MCQLVTTSIKFLLLNIEFIYLILTFNNLIRIKALENINLSKMDFIMKFNQFLRFDENPLII